jgi:hypothetical protein
MLPRAARRAVQPRFRNAILALALASVCALLAAEGAFRFLLFSDTSVARRLGARLRDPAHFADHTSEDEYWRLQALFDGQLAGDHLDAVCGWTGPYIEDGTYVPKTWPDLRGRTPVLLYGDSYATGCTPPEQRFPAILAKSDLADRYVLVDYGVGGYGVDQIYLLLHHSIDRWRDLDPIVIVSFFVDDDFSRNVLGFRCWPKPHFTIRDGRLVSDGPVLIDPEKYRAQHPLGIRSYFLRFLAYRRNVIPEKLQRLLRSSDGRLEEKKALGKKLLEEIHRDLAERHIRHFFLAFHGELGVRDDIYCRWVDELVVDTARELGVPLMPTRPFLLAAAGGDPERTKPFFGGSPLLNGHYNARGNLIAFEAIRAGIEGRFDPIDTSPAADLKLDEDFVDAERREAITLLGFEATVRTRGASGFARVSKTPYRPFPDGSKDPYLVLRPGEQGPTEVRFLVKGRAIRLQGQATSLSHAKGRQTDPPVIEIRVDGRLVTGHDVPFYPAQLGLDVDLAGAQQVEIVVDRKGPSPDDAWIHVAGARIE